MGLRDADERHRAGDGQADLRILPCVLASR
jgi:hypothetical protein